MNAVAMFERAMGDRYAQLPAGVQRFHRLAGRHVLHGRVETAAPATTGARLLARLLRLPGHADAGLIRFELDAHATAEVWTRHFPGRTMTSRLSLCGTDNCTGSVIEERLGPARLTFELVAAPGVLRMALRRLRFLGLPCPAWLMPRIVAEEHGDAHHLHFDVSAALPWIGQVAHYQGHLALGPEASA